MAWCINWSSKTQCIVPLSFHFLSNADLLHSRGLQLYSELWIVVNWSVFCLSFVTLRTTHQHYVSRWRRESVAVTHLQSSLCTAYLPSVTLPVCGLLWHSRAHWLKWNGVTVSSMVSQTVWLCLCVVCGVCIGVWWEIAGGEREELCVNLFMLLISVHGYMCVGVGVLKCTCIVCAHHLWM